jgi:hypothetical protein
MPGFVVRGVDGVDFGGQVGERQLEATDEYYYSYTWEIFELFTPNYSHDQHVFIKAKNITLPTFSVGIETNQGASLEYKFAKNVSYDDVKVTFYDAVGTIDILKDWRKRVWTSAEGLKIAEDYKRMSEIDVYTPTWDEDERVKWKLTGSWPSVIRHGELTYTSSDVKIVEVTVTYDFAESERRGN